MCDSIENIERDSIPLKSIVKLCTLTPAAYQREFIAVIQDHCLVDVRAAEEFVSGHIPGSANIPLQEISQRLSEIPKTKPVVVYCRSGNRSAQATQLLQKAGYTQIYDLGGILDWQEQGLPIE